MPHGVHSTVQTAFRIPEAVLARLKAQAETEAVTATAYVIAAIEEKLARSGHGITTDGVPPEPVSPPPKRARRSRADTAPPVVLREPCPHPKARIQKGLCANCGTYVGICKPAGGK